MENEKAVYRSQLVNNVEIEIEFYLNKYEPDEDLDVTYQPEDEE